MTIADTLSDACHQIRSYLEDEDPQVERHAIDEVLHMMERVYKLMDNQVANACWDAYPPNARLQHGKFGRDENERRKRWRTVVKELVECAADPAVVVMDRDEFLAVCVEHYDEATSRKGRAL